MAKPHTSYQAPIQFRPSDSLQRWIAEYAGTWEVTENEAAKRLAAVAASRLNVEYYPLLVSLSEALSGPFESRTDFLRACNQVKIALDGANRARQEMGKKPLVYEEQAKFIQKIIEDAVTNTQVQRKVEQTKV